MPSGLPRQAPARCIDSGRLLNRCWRRLWAGPARKWGAFMRLSRRAAAGILLTGASVLISGNFFATEALAARKRSPSKSYFATLQRNDGEESESERLCHLATKRRRRKAKAKQETTRATSPCVFISSSRRADESRRASHARAWVTQTQQCSALFYLDPQSSAGAPLDLA